VFDPYRSFAKFVMHKVNMTMMAEVSWSSPHGKHVGAGREVSEALGRKPKSTDLNERIHLTLKFAACRRERRLIHFTHTPRSGSSIM